MTRKELSQIGEAVTQLDKQFKCRECGEIFQRQADGIQHHIKKHQKPEEDKE